MSRISAALLLLSVAASAACSKGGDASYERAPAVSAPQPDGLNRNAAPPADAVAGGQAKPEAPAPPNPSAVQTPTDSAAVPRMIIRTGEATLRVDSLEPAIARVTRLAEQLGGFVANTEVTTGDRNVRQGTLEIRIPSPRWNDAMSGLRPIGRLEGSKSTSEDVSEEYVDVTARMDNARRLEARLVALLENRTGRLEDVLAVERELARVREEIERYEGRLRFLRSRVAMSTLTVRLHEPFPLLEPGDNPILGAFRDAWRNFVGFTAGLIAALGWLIPLLVLLALFVWVLRRAGLRRPSRPQPPVAPPAP